MQNKITIFVEIPMTDRHATLPIDEIARFPLPGMAVPGALAFSPDGRWLTYLHSPDCTLTRRLFALELDSGWTVEIEPPGREVTEENITLEEALRRERMRLRETGITSYAWGGKSAACPISRWPVWFEWPRTAVIPVGGGRKRLDPGSEALFRWEMGGVCTG